MEKMKLEWGEMYFEFIPYRDTVSYQSYIHIQWWGEVRGDVGRGDGGAHANRHTQSHTQ